jgi:hypothetical protein
MRNLIGEHKSVIFIVGPSIFVILLWNNQPMRRGSSSIFINAFLYLPQHVSASHYHHHGVVFSSEATQTVCIVDVCGLRSVQCCQLSRDVTKCVPWVQFLRWLRTNWTHRTHLVTFLDNWQHWTDRNPYTSTIQTVWVASDETTTP